MEHGVLAVGLFGDDSAPCLSLIMRFVLSLACLLSLGELAEAGKSSSPPRVRAGRSRARTAWPLRNNSSLGQVEVKAKVRVQSLGRGPAPFISSLAAQQSQRRVQLWEVFVDRFTNMLHENR